MCSVLTVIATFIISFILACDFVELAPIELIDSSCRDGNCNTEESTAQKAIFGTAQLVFASKGDTNFAAPQDQTNQVAAPNTPFSRSSIHCPDIERNDFLCHGTVEMPALQKNLLWKARMLCTVRPVLEILFRPRLRATTTKGLAEAGSVETKSLGWAGQLECRAVDSIPKKTAITQEAIQPPCSQKQCWQRQRKRKGAGRAAALWASALTSYPIAGTSLASWHDPTIDHQLLCHVGQFQQHYGHQGREGQRQANEISGCRIETAQRRASGGAAIPRERGDGPQWPGGNENPSLCGVPARESKEGTSRSTGRTPAHAWRMEELPCAICGPVVQIYRTIHAAGTPDAGTPQSGPGEPSSRKGKSGSVQISCRPGVQRGVSADERCRRYRAKGGRDVSRAENCGKLSGLSNKSPNATQASRASCAAGSRARPDAQTPEDVHARTVSRCKRRRWHAPFFWGARVNTFAPRIAHGQPHKCDQGGLLHPSLQPVPLPADCMPVTNESIFNPALKWNHSVLYEPDFVDEWMAADNAFHLAHEIAANHACFLHVNASDAAIADVPQGRTSQSVQCFSNQKLYKDFAGIFLPHAMAPNDDSTCARDDASLFRVHVSQQHIDAPVPPHCEDSGPCLKTACDCSNYPPCECSKVNPLQSTDIDGMIHPVVASPHQPSKSLDLGIPSDVDDDEVLMITDVPVPHDQPYQPDVGSVLNQLESLTDANPALQPMVDPIPYRHEVQFCPEIDLYIGCEDQWKFHHIRILEDSLVMHSKPWSLTPPEGLHHDGRLSSELTSINNVTQVPNSFHHQEVLSHDKLSFPHETDQIICTYTPRRQVFYSQGKPEQKLSEIFVEDRIQTGLPPELVSQCRLEHESPIGWLPPNDGNDEDENPEDQIPPNFDEEPALVRHLRNKFLQLGFVNFDGDFEVPIRTWYLDHVNVRRWTAPRILQLVGPPHTWEQQFMSLWVDQIDPNDWFDLSIVEPDPPRVARHSFVLLDAILTQSLHMDRYPGLVTVMPQQLDSFDLFSVAYSFADFISGFDVVLAADAVSMCRYHPCTITFGWDEIPHSLRPEHVMRPGDGFQVLVRPGPLQLAEPVRRSSAAASSSQVPQTQPNVDASANLTFSTPEHPLMDDPMHRRFTTPLHLFQLDAHEVIVDLVNAQLAHPSHDIADAADVPFDCVEAVHMLIARPLDFPELAIPAILQRTGDLPLHSTDRLILIDTVYYHHSSGSHAHSRPTVVRTVHRLPHQVIRPQLLTAAAVYQYCLFLQETCEVFLDDRRWPSTEVEPRSLRHGSYARIEVPPPVGYDVDTMTAAAVVQHDADNDAFMELLQTELDEDDATFLAQVTASRVFAHPQLCKIRSILESTHLDTLPGVEGEPSTMQEHSELSVALPADTVQWEDGRIVAPHSGNGLTHTSPSSMFSCGAVPASDQPRSNQECNEMACHPHQNKQVSLHRFFFASKSSVEASSELPTLSARSSEAHQQPPPTFEQALPNPVPDDVPQRPRLFWQIELESLFDELARVRYIETGPTLTVSVWYIHHVRFPMCHAPRLVELDDIRELWYADLCNAWWDHILRNEPIKVLMVRPNPDNQLQPRAQIHIILEQRFSQDKAALVFTAIFLANYRNGIFQKAESVDASICTQYMIDKHDFNHFCDFRTCNMFSGLLRFHQHVPEEIFSGISVTLVVGPPNQASSSTDRLLRVPDNADTHDSPDETILMQGSRRWQRARPSEAANPAPVRQPSLQIFDAREFRTTLQWTMQQSLETCADIDERPMRIQSWFLDSFRVTRSETPRTVLLRPMPHTWVSDILARWQDTINPQKLVYLHVVQPTPTDSTDEIMAHVLIVQTPNDLWRAALLSVVHFNTDPWNPSHIALMLDKETTVDQIAFIAHISHPVNPLRDHQQVEVRHASIILENRAPFHVRDGYHFDVIVTDVADAWRDDIALIQLSFQSVQSSMRKLHHSVSGGYRKCVIEGTHEQAPPLVAISITQNPTQTPVTSPWDSLPFHGYLQALWQPLSLLSPDRVSPTVSIITWYLDHVRYPQCFEAREARLSGDTTGWLRQMRRLWFHVIIPIEPLHFHIVQPRPPNADADVAAHVLLVQQPIEGFRSVLVSVFDSAFLGAQIDRFASMAPNPLAFSTLVGLAYRDIDCQDPANTCDAWIGREELHPVDIRPIIDGHSVVVAVHRPIPAGPADGDPWNADVPRHRTPDAAPSRASHTAREGQCQVHVQTRQRVPLCLDACLPHRSATLAPFSDQVSTLLWSVRPSWKQSIAESLANIVHPVPTGVVLPDTTCCAINASMNAHFDPTAEHVFELYIDGATGPAHAGWAVAIVAKIGPEPDASRRLIGVTGGTVTLDPHHPQWVGATKPDNIAAEFTALLAAQAIILQQETHTLLHQA